jgi:hypothetical protein
MSVRWFVCRGVNDVAILVFRTEWDGYVLTHEEVWNKVAKVWQPSNEVQRWWLKGETNVDEISSLEARELLTKQGES